MRTAKILSKIKKLKIFNKRLSRTMHLTKKYIKKEMIKMRMSCEIHSQ